MAPKYVKDATELIQRKATVISEKYNGDADSMPGLPIVTYTEKQLLDMIVDLTRIINDLQQQINWNRMGV